MTTAEVVASLVSAASRSFHIRDGEANTEAATGASSSAQAAIVDVLLTQESYVTATRLPSGTTAQQATVALEATICHERPPESCSVELLEGSGDEQRRLASSALTFIVYWALGTASLPSSLSSNALEPPTLDSSAFAAQLSVSESDVSFEQAVVQDISAEIIVANLDVDATYGTETTFMATSLATLTSQSLGIPADAIALTGPPRVIMPPRPPPSEPPAPAPQATGPTTPSSSLTGVLHRHAAEIALGAGVLVAVCVVAFAMKCFLRSRPRQRASPTPIFRQWANSKNAAAGSTSVSSRPQAQRDRRRPMEIKIDESREGVGNPINSTALIRQLSPGRLLESMPSPRRIQYGRLDGRPAIQHLSSYI